MTTIPTKRWGGAAAVLALAGALAALNFLADGLRLRRDLTADRLYTLTPGTRQLLRELPRPVTLKLYATRGGAGVPPLLKQFAGRVEDLLREYQLHGRGRIELEVYDPQPDSDEEEWARKYGLQGQPLSPFGDGPTLYLGVAAVSGTREAALPMIAPEQEPQLEYQLTRLLYEVTRAGKPKVGLLSSLDLMGEEMPAFMMGGRRGKPAWTLVDELRKQYDVVRLEPTLEEAPADLTALVVVHPQELPPRALFALDQFVLRGGRLLVFMDPLCVAQQQEAGSQQMMMGQVNSASDLNALTSAWGVELKAGQVAADPRAATPLRIGDGRAVERHPAWLSLREENIRGEDAAVGALKTLMLPFPGFFEVKPIANLTATPLLQTSDDAGALDAMGALMGGGRWARPSGDRQRRPLAVRLTGHFSTAFPNGMPAATNETPAAALSESATNGVVTLVADVDLLHDDYAVQDLNFLGYQARQLANDNLNFALNMVEELTGSAALIGLRSRGRFERPFGRVLALAAAAEERWRAEEDKLQERLAAAQQRLGELQRQKDPTQKFILSAEQRREIEKFRQQEFDTQRQLKEVRKNLRRDIESLGQRLKIANLAVVPLLVAAYGLARALRRRRAAQGA